MCLYIVSACNIHTPTRICGDDRRIWVAHVAEHHPITVILILVGVALWPNCTSCLLQLLKV
jgi:hypothetical protein